MAFDMSAFQQAAEQAETVEKSGKGSTQTTTYVAPADVPALCEAIVLAYSLEPDLARVKAAGKRLDGSGIMAAAFKDGNRNVAIYAPKHGKTVGACTWVNLAPLN